MRDIDKLDHGFKTKKESKFRIILDADLDDYWSEELYCTLMDSHICYPMWEQGEYGIDIGYVCYFDDLGKWLQARDYICQCISHMDLDEPHQCIDFEVADATTDIVTPTF